MADDAGRIEALYDTDVVAWAEQQAALLRQRASGDELDYDNLADEIEDVSRTQTRACRSAIDQIIEHLLKLEYAPSVSLERACRGWRISVRKQRHELEDELTPTLRRRLPAELARRYERQVEYCEDAGILDHTAATNARSRGPYTWDQITDEDWWPEPR